MVQLIWALPAIEDLERIVEYIALDKPDSAVTFAKRVFQVVDQLKHHPKMGPYPKELKSRSYRQLIINPCRIFYRINGNKILILHVMRAEQLLNVKKLFRKID